MIIAEEAKEAQDWVVVLVGGVGSKDTQGVSKVKIGDTMIMPIFVHLLKHEELAIKFLNSGGV